MSARRKLLPGQSLLLRERSIGRRALPRAAAYGYEYPANPKRRSVFAGALQLSNQAFRCFSASASLSSRATEYLQLQDPDLTDSQRTVREAITKICSKFPDDYWLDVDQTKKWPIEFTTAIAKDGWLGICQPVEYGGSELGLAEATTMMQTVSESGGGESAALRVPRLLQRS